MTLKVTKRTYYFCKNGTNENDFFIFEIVAIGDTIECGYYRPRLPEISQYHAPDTEFKKNFSRKTQ